MGRFVCSKARVSEENRHRQNNSKEHREGERLAKAIKIGKANEEDTEE